MIQGTQDLVSIHGENESDREETPDDNGLHLSAQFSRQAAATAAAASERVVTEVAASFDQMNLVKTQLEKQLEVAQKLAFVANNDLDQLSRICLHLRGAGGFFGGDRIRLKLPPGGCEKRDEGLEELPAILFGKNRKPRPSKCHEKPSTIS